MTRKFTGKIQVGYSVMKFKCAQKCNLRYFISIMIHFHQLYTLLNNEFAQKKNAMNIKDFVQKKMGEQGKRRNGFNSFRKPINRLNFLIPWNISDELPSFWSSNFFFLNSGLQQCEINVKTRHHLPYTW